MTLKVENPLDIYIRARDTFLKSLFDGMGAADAAAEYSFSLLNMQRHEVVYPWSNQDIICQSMVEPVLKQFDEMNQAEQRMGMGFGQVDHLWQGSFESSIDQPHLIGRQFPQNISEGTEPYDNVNPFGEEFHPLMENDAYIHSLLSFYLQPAPGVPSQSEIDKNKELAVERRLEKEQSPLLKNDRFGPLGENMTSHDIMMRHFDEWKADNPHLVSKYESMSPEESEYNLRQEHLLHMWDEWTSDEHEETQGTWDYEGQATEDMLHPKKLGFNDYLYGLEFLSPAARHDVHAHGRDSGSGFDSEHSVPHVTGGRVKRSHAQRFSPIFSHWTREAEDFGPNLNVTPEVDKQRSVKDVFNAAPASVIGNMLLSHDIYDKLLEHHNKITGERHEILPSLRAGEGFIHRNEAYADSIYPAEMQLLMGINRHTGELYPKGKHPIYGEHWNPESIPWTAGDYNKIRDEVNEMSLAGPQKDTRNHAMPHLVQHIHSEHVPWKDEPWHQEGDNTTLSTHWGIPMQNRGGYGSSAETLMDILHHSHVHEQEGALGHSIMFKKDALENRLVPNEKNRGLTGPFWHSTHGAHDLSPFGTSHKADNQKTNWMWHTSSHNAARHNQILDTKPMNRKLHSKLFKQGPYPMNNVHMKGEWTKAARLDSAHKSSNALVTMAGLMHPPHAPMPTQTLSPRDVVRDSQSSTGTSAGWHHDQVGTGERELRGDHDAIIDMQEVAIEAEDAYMNLRDEAERKEEHGISLSEEEKDALQEAYDDKLNAQNALVRQMGSKKMGFHKDNLRDKHEKLDSDMSAIADGTSKIREMMEKEGFDFFPEGDKSQWLGNVLNAFNYGNRYINQVPHSIHGVSSMGVGEDRIIERLPQTHHAGLHQILHNKGETVHSGMSNEKIAEALGMGEDGHHRGTVRDLKSRLKEMDEEHGERVEVPAMRVADMMRHLPNIDIESDDINSQLQEARANKSLKGSAAHKASQMMGMLLGSVPQYQKQFGLHWIDAEQRHPEHKGRKSTLPMQSGKERKQREGSGTRITQKLGQKEKDDRNMYNSMQRADSIILGDKTKKPNPKGILETHKVRTGKMRVPIGNAGHPTGNGVYPIFSSPFFRKHWGHSLSSDFSLDIGPHGNISINRHEGGRERSLTTVPLPLLQKVFPEIIPHLPELGVHILNNPRAMRPNRYAEVSMHGKDMHKSLEMLLSMTDPDILIKAEQPFIRPMHRIFELSDLDELRGFTGDWVVSAWYQGKRMFVKRDEDEVSARDEDGEVELSDDVKEAFKKTTEKNFEIDVVQTEDGYYAHDILSFDDDEVHDEGVSDRIKMMRGAMESVEPIHMPSASDTKNTDDEGLEATVEEIRKDFDDILLRDAKSTYMKGESRHPKSVLLSKSKKVDLIVLDKEGDGPYDYRLGIGPITNSDKLGDRAVEMDGHTYMDVGTIFHSKEDFSPGDLVNVDVDSVSSFEKDGQPIFTVHGGSISGAGDGAVVSSETLSLLTKGLGGRLVPHRIEVNDGALSIHLAAGDVIYKIDDMKPTSNGYLARLAESQRPFWAPLASLMLKTDISSIQEEEDTVGEGEEEAEPIIPPKKIEDTEHWKKAILVTKACEVMDKLLKQVGMVGHTWSAGPKGLGIDYATPTESPSGPTSTRDESSLPDFDPRSRPLEDPEDEYDEKPDGEDEETHLVIDTKDGTGELSIGPDRAVFRI